MPGIFLDILPSEINSEAMQFFPFVNKIRKCQFRYKKFQNNLNIFYIFVI